MTVTDSQNKIISYVMISINPGETLSEEKITGLVDAFSKMEPLSDKEKEEVIKTLHTRLEIRMDRGAFVKEKDHKSWYNNAKKDLKTDFWDRYVTYLINEKGLSRDVIGTLDGTTDEMMDLLGNPSQENNFQRRGLVIGDVQSGKTATYTALINKAADANYRIIILLTGTIEKLRKQTQSRLDEGFIGLDSTAFTRDKNNILVGVGNINPSVSGWAVTSTTSDFNTSTGQKLSGRLSGINSPVLFVLKKNKSVLQKLEQWLRLYNANQGQTSPLPMLLIDDEADNASVNTKTDEDPAAINAEIRKLLKLFSHANYVGFTATPFANIFIDPDSNQEMLDDDLFPKDFIYALEAPTNYVGARSIFSENGKHSYMLHINDDCERYLPEKHKKEYEFHELPPSLKEAIASFFIINAVRDLRGTGNKNRTMLINISRFIAVQEQITKIIDEYVRDFQREIKNYHLIGKEALEYESFSFLMSVFNKYFTNIPGFEYKWDDIQKSLYKAVASVVVKSVNGGNASKNLNYDEYDDGLRLIAVGGYSLSRGLTLEGLCVSYFYRNSKMYDTLMQMGRWFGYRDGYEDLCQIWMSEGAVDWYTHISEASDELRQEVRKMQDQNKTPKEFGLYVRSDINNVLLVTARNKMKTARDYKMTVSLNGTVIETPYLFLESEKLNANIHACNLWYETLKKDGLLFNKFSNLSLENNYQILNVPKKYICKLLDSFQCHFLNVDFNTHNLVQLINNSRDESFAKWDIVIASGDGEEISFGDLKIKSVKRNFGLKKDYNALQMSGKRSRLGDPRMAKGGLTKQQAEDIEKPEKDSQKKDGKSHTIKQEIYFRSEIKRNPLLVIYPVTLSHSDTGESDDIEKNNIINKLPIPLIGLSIGIPETEGMENKTYTIKINKIKFKELFDVEEDFEEEEVPITPDGGIDNV